jgi:hypothetical protein
LVTKIESVLRSRLLIAPSELRRLNPRNGAYDQLIGNGLFSKELIRAGTQVVHFCGEELQGYAAVQEARVQLEHGGYVVANLTETYGVDCFDNKC